MRSGKKDLEKEVGMDMTDVKATKPVTDGFRNVWDKQLELIRTKVVAGDLGSVRQL